MPSVRRMILVAALLLAGAATPSMAGSIGVVLLHGKTGLPGGMKKTANVLERKGVLTIAPEAPWSKTRIYAASYLDSLKEIDEAVKALKRRGATEIYIAGHSQGANAALGYAARRSGLAGIALLAPGHSVGFEAFDRRNAKFLEKAKRLIGKGKGDKAAEFKDLNQGKMFPVDATPNIYLSWFDPAGPAALKTNAAALPDGLAVLCVDGSQEPHPRCRAIMAKVKPGKRRETITVDATHKATAKVASEKLAAWLTAR